MMSRAGMTGIRKMSCMAVLTAALLGAGVAYADECSDAWDDSNAADHCDDAGDSVTVENIAGTNKCSVDIACYVNVNLLNGPEGDSLPVRFFSSNPPEWRVWENDDGTDNSATNGLVRTSVDDITICFYQGSLTDAHWVDWAEKVVAGSCATGEIDVDDAVNEGLDMRTSAN